MKIKLSLLFVALLCSFATIFAQSPTLKGSLSDTSSSKSSLQNATIAILRAKDSILQKFTRSDAEGKFEIKNVQAGSYILMISHPDFAEYVDIIDIQKDNDLGAIVMLTKAVVLQNVIVRGSPIRMKGDTLVFVADSFKTREGATVEDLLKRLPGVQVNAKGEITAQGEKVTKVLVDGDEFFGDDPTLATQNMIAKAVKEVEVYDKKSDQATFTGVDDGEKTKTINLKLKDEFKKGYFGKVKLAGGIPNSWENSAMINAFKDKRKFSVYGKMANTKETGLAWGENNQYGGGIGTNMEMTDDGDMMMWSQGDDFGGVGSFYGEGLPKAWMGGASYSDKWNSDKNNIVGAYRYQKLNTSGDNTQFSQNIISDTQYLSNEASKNWSSKWRQSGNMKTDITLDSLQSLTITADGSFGKSFSTSELTSRSLMNTSLFQNQIANENERRTSNEGNNGAFNANILYKKKFAKKGRTLSLNLSERYSSNNSTGHLFSRLLLYKGGVYSSADTTDQRKDNGSNSLNIGARVAYTEPIGKNGIVEASYGYNLTNSEQKRLSYDKVDGKFDDLNETFSNDYKFFTGTHKIGAGYRYNYKKLVFGFASDIALSNWKQTNVFTDSVRSYNFTNFFPRANISYKLGQYSRLRFNYNGGTRAPSINQLQPVQNNEDPLNIAIGNPNLKQSFRQNFNMGYNFYQVLKEQGLWANLFFNQSNNDFSSYDRIDTSGKRTYQTVNVNGNYSFGGYIGYNFKWKKADINFDFSINPNVSVNNNFVNGTPNKTTNNNYSFSIGANQYKDKKYEVRLSIDAGYTYSKSSVNKAVVTKYWTTTPNISTTIFLPKDFELSTDADYNWRQTTVIFPNNNNAFIWNASLTKKIFKKQDIRLGVKVRDILNQNIGFRRDASSNYISERTYNVIRRYGLATLTWNFNKGPKKEEQW
jgi:outer membrane receptor protein involved in Fe transport